MTTLRISDNGVSVTYRSDDDKEIEAINDCFGYFWQTGEAEEANAAARWSVVCERVESLDQILHRDHFTLTADLYKETDLSKAQIGDRHYYRHIVAQSECLTCFDLSAGVTHFYYSSAPRQYSYIRNLVREPIAAQYKRNGHLLMHASACAINNSGIIMPGFKGAGKSTLLSHLLENGASYIANDAVLCKPDQGQVLLTAYPQCVRLSSETIQNNAGLKRYFDAPHAHPFIKEKFEFLPSLYDSLYCGHHLSNSADLEIVLMPALDLSKRGYSIREGDNSAAQTVLRESMFYPYHNYIWSPFFEELNEPELDHAMFRQLFGLDARVIRLDYGILDSSEQERLFQEIAEILRT